MRKAGYSLWMLLVMAFLQVCYAGSLLAQETPFYGEWESSKAEDRTPVFVLPPGSRLRVTTIRWARPVLGQLVTVDADSLVLMTDPGRSVHLAPREVDRIEVSNGSRSFGYEWFLNGAATGILIGGTAGFFEHRTDEDANPKIFKWAAVVGAGCGLIGAIIGANTKEEIWEPVDWSVDFGSSVAPADVFIAVSWPIK